jgi:glycosyltransferase involved in cell wall biosynthesis
MLLSIGMIVKNEERFLKRCLEALSPILEQVPSELIIADTGSTDKTVDIARQFTDNVFHFDWCDDFAAARNSTLKKAKGEWYLFIDADEIVDNCADIVNFFSSGEYRRYNSASIIIRSFNDEKQKVKASIRVVRLVKRSRNLEFQNPVHERLNIVNPPLKPLNVIFDHYGYVTENNEDFVKSKMERNLRLMLAEEERRPDDCVNLLNIVQTHLLLGNLEAGLGYCEKGIKYAREQKSFLEHIFYIRKAQFNLSLENYANTLAVIDEYFKSKNTTLVSDLEMYVYKAKSHTHLNAFDQAIEAYKNYISLYDEYKRGLLHTPDEYYSSVNYIDEALYVNIVLDLIDLLIHVDDFEAAKFYRDLPALTNFQDDGDITSRRLLQDFEIIKRSSDYAELPLLYDRLNSEQQSALETMIEEFLQGGDIDDLSVYACFYNSKIRKTPYVKLMKLRHLHCTGSLAPKDVEAVLDALETVDEPYADLVYLTFYSGASLKLLGSKLSPYDFAETAYSNTRCCRQWPRYALSSLDGTAGSFEAERHLWISVLHERALLSDITGGEIKPALFYEYGRHYGSYMGHILKAETLREEHANLLPRPLRTGLLCSLAAKYKAEGKLKEYVQTLRHIIKSDPRFSPVVQLLTDELSTDKLSGEKTNRDPEFYEYARTIKKNIAYLCEINETEKALGLLAAYEQLNPNDEEIAALKARLENRT